MSTPVKSSNRKGLRKRVIALFSKQSSSSEKIASRSFGIKALKISPTPTKQPQSTAPVQKQLPFEKLKRHPPLPKDVAQEIAKNGLDPTCPDILRRRYPLAWACANGRLDILETILNENPDHPFLCSRYTLKRVVPNSGPELSWNSKTPFCIALEAGHFDAARLLLKHGAPAKYVRNMREIFAVCNENPELLELVIKDTFTTLPSEGSRPFQTAVCNGDLENAKILLKHGAASGYTDRTKERMVAQCGDNTELMRMVLEQTLATDETAPNPTIMALRVWVLIFAMQRRKVKCVRLLWEESGCHEYVRQTNARTTTDALYYLHRNLCEMETHHSATLEYMLQCGAVAAIHAMWQRSKNNVKNVWIPSSEGYRFTPRRTREDEERILDMVLRYD